MRFIGYVRAAIRGAKIDWEADVELTPVEREALLPHDPTTLRGGRLRRPFHVKPQHAGTRTKPVRHEEVVHRKGALVFATSDDSFFLLEADDEE
jgi:hypothetical protein